ncbi:Hsp20/alpha crystallin family protein [Rhodohalobacter mucosus]|nr:Hsp20/alpha crystallin family protein [Rhodohalobacter mucosus]
MKVVKKRTHEPGSIDLLRREMDQFFDDLVPFSWTREKGGRALSAWSPNADMTEDEKEYMIRMDIPGMKKDDINVNFQDGRITISGERKEEEKEEKKDFVRQERYYGSFYRSFTLPENVKEDEIEARFKNGVLELVIPKAEVVKPKSIKVN